MSLQERINADLHTAMKNKDEDTKSLLRVIIGDMSRGDAVRGRKEMNDDEVLKLLKNMREEAIFMKNSTEIEIIDRYLPKMLTEQELREAINAIVLEKNITDVKGMGIIMGSLKQKYGPLYDGKSANQIIKEIF